MARGKRVEIVKLTVDGAEVDAKACTKCGKVKALTYFCKDVRASDGRNCRCRECRNPNSGRTRPDRPTKACVKPTYVYWLEEETSGEIVTKGISESNINLVIHKHIHCGREWEVCPKNFKRRPKCPFCYPTDAWKEKTTTQYRQEVRNLVGSEYSVLGEYTNARTNISHIHTKCGYVWDVAPTNFLRGRRCPKCMNFKGEKRIVDFIESWGLSARVQYKFEKCRYKRPLPFDVALVEESGLILIEYDGEQHFHPVACFGGIKGHLERSRNDRIKTEYCRANGIPLIRIDYTQFDEIEAILDRELSALGVTGKRNNTDNNENTKEEAVA